MDAFRKKVWAGARRAHGGGEQRFRGGLVFKPHRLCVSPTTRLASNKEEEAAREAQTPPPKN